MQELDNPYKNMVATHTNDAEFDNEPSLPASFTTGVGFPPVNPDPAATSMSTDPSVIQASCSGATSGSAAHAVVPASGDDASDFQPLVPMTASGDPVPPGLAASTTTPASGAEAPLPSRRGPGMSRHQGQTEEIKPNDTVSASVLLMMQKSQQTITQWHYKHLQLCPERKCKIGMGKTYTQFYRKWSEVKNKLY
ncbi:hypothetical protein PCASD_05702 [Puccinia coronata f. sp. avenae]|uniref:Uncharacterized protein n=1 Tax=Puccinia coronata f. sp. avenae TaxID=200324 RepID=A0A2N5UVC2_9BASI|nr:hypothetical protein PCASD_05702 [Puccinia coronata f. sp. avenae]